MRPNKNLRSFVQNICGRARLNLDAGPGQPFRCGIVVSREQPSPYSAVLAKFITMMLAGQQPTIYGDGAQNRISPASLATP